jgi:monoamine oxidase
MEGKSGASSSSAFPPQSSINHATVVVIGSGISGMFCAYELRKKGIDVLVVEATNWIG